MILSIIKISQTYKFLQFGTIKSQTIAKFVPEYFWEPNNHDLGSVEQSTDFLDVLQ